MPHNPASIVRLLYGELAQKRKQRQSVFSQSRQQQFDIRPSYRSRPSDSRGSALALRCKARYGLGQSAAINRRSRWGSVRGWPVLSSHFFPEAAPQVGQGIASTCFRLSSFFMAQRNTAPKPMHKAGQIWTLYTLTGNLNVS